MLDDSSVPKTLDVGLRDFEVLTRGRDAEEVAPVRAAQRDAHSDGVIAGDELIDSVPQVRKSAAHRGHDRFDAGGPGHWVGNARGMIHVVAGE